MTLLLRVLAYGCGGAVIGCLIGSAIEFVKRRRVQAQVDALVAEAIEDLRGAAALQAAELAARLEIVHGALGWCEYLAPLSEKESDELQKRMMNDGARA